MSNPVSLQVLDATAAPERGGLALVLSGLADVVALWRRILLPAAWAVGAAIPDPETPLVS